MNDLTSIGRMLLVFGAIVLVAGGLMMLFGRGFRLPGDLLIRRDTVTIYIPIATSIVLSLLLTLVLNLLLRR